MSSGTPSKKEALGLYIRDTATKLQRTGDALRLIILVLAVLQMIMGVYMMAEFWRFMWFSQVNVMVIIFFLTMPVTIIGAFFLAGFVRQGSDLLAMISFKMVEKELTEKDFGNFPMIPTTKNESSSCVGQEVRGEERESPHQEL